MSEWAEAVAALIADADVPEESLAGIIDDWSARSRAGEPLRYAWVWKGYTGKTSAGGLPESRWYDPATKKTRDQVASPGSGRQSAGASSGGGGGGQQQQEHGVRANASRDATRGGQAAAGNASGKAKTSQSKEGVARRQQLVAKFQGMSAAALKKQDVEQLTKELSELSLPQLNELFGPAGMDLPVPVKQPKKPKVAAIVAHVQAYEPKRGGKKKAEAGAAQPGAEQPNQQPQAPAGVQATPAAQPQQPAVTPTRPAAAAPAQPQATAPQQTAVAQPATPAPQPQAQPPAWPAAAQPATPPAAEKPPEAAPPTVAMQPAARDRAPEESAAPTPAQDTPQPPAPTGQQQAQPQPGQTPEGPPPGWTPERHVGWTMRRQADDRSLPNDADVKRMHRHFDRLLDRKQYGTIRDAYAGFTGEEAPADADPEQMVNRMLEDWQFHKPEGWTPKQTPAPIWAGGKPVQKPAAPADQAAAVPDAPARQPPAAPEPQAPAAGEPPAPAAGEPPVETMKMGAAGLSGPLRPIEPAGADLTAGKPGGSETAPATTGKFDLDVNPDHDQLTGGEGQDTPAQEPAPAPSDAAAPQAPPPGEPAAAPPTRTAPPTQMRPPVAARTRQQSPPSPRDAAAAPTEAPETAETPTPEDGARSRAPDEAAPPATAEKIATPTPSPEQTGEPVPGKETRQEAAGHLRRFSDALEKNTSLHPEQKRRYKEAAASVISRMSPAMLERLGRAVGDSGVSFYASPPQLAGAIADYYEKTYKNAEVAAKLRARPSAGCFIPAPGNAALNGLHPDGGGANLTGNFAGHNRADEVYAHEMSHAIDCAGAATPGHSLSPDWLAAYEGEIKGGGLTKYAGVDPSEGWAEFGRLLLTGDYDRASVKASFPRCFDYWVKNGLIDDVAADQSQAKPELPEAFSEKIPMPGTNGHADVALARPEPAEPRSPTATPAPAAEQTPAAGVKEANAPSAAAPAEAPAAATAEQVSRQAPQPLAPASDTAVAGENRPVGGGGRGIAASASAAPQQPKPGQFNASVKRLKEGTEPQLRALAKAAGLDPEAAINEHWTSGRAAFPRTGPHKASAQTLDAERRRALAVAIARKDANAELPHPDEAALHRSADRLEKEAAQLQKAGKPDKAKQAKQAASTTRKSAALIGASQKKKREKVAPSAAAETLPAPVVTEQSPQEKPAGTPAQAVQEPPAPTPPAAAEKPPARPTAPEPVTPSPVERPPETQRSAERTPLAPQPVPPVAKREADRPTDRPRTPFVPPEPKNREGWEKYYQRVGGGKRMSAEDYEALRKKHEDTLKQRAIARRAGSTIAAQEPKEQVKEDLALSSPPTASDVQGASPSDRVVDKTPSGGVLPHDDLASMALRSGIPASKIEQMIAATSSTGGKYRRMNLDEAMNLISGSEGGSSDDGSFGNWLEKVHNVSDVKSLTPEQKQSLHQQYVNSKRPAGEVELPPKTSTPPRPAASPTPGKQGGATQPTRSSPQETPKSPANSPKVDKTPSGGASVPSPSDQAVDRPTTPQAPPPGQRLAQLKERAEELSRMRASGEYVDPDEFRSIVDEILESNDKMTPNEKKVLRDRLDPATTLEEAGSAGTSRQNKKQTEERALNKLGVGKSMHSVLATRADRLIDQAAKGTVPLEELRHVDGGDRKAVRSRASASHDKHERGYAMIEEMQNELERRAESGELTPEYEEYVSRKSAQIARWFETAGDETPQWVEEPARSDGPGVGAGGGRGAAVTKGRKKAAVKPPAQNARRELVRQYSRLADEAARRGDRHSARCYSMQARGEF